MPGDVKVCLCKKTENSFLTEVSSLFLCYKGWLVFCSICIGPWHWAQSKLSSLCSWRLIRSTLHQDPMYSSKHPWRRGDCSLLGPAYMYSEWRPHGFLSKLSAGRQLHQHQQQSQDHGTDMEAPCQWPTAWPLYSSTAELCSLLFHTAWLLMGSHVQSMW